MLSLQKSSSLILVMLIVILSASAHSQSLTAPSDNGGARSQMTEGAQQQTKRDQRGSEQAPFVVKILTAEQTQKESPSNSGKGPQNPDDSWGFSTKIAIFATIAGFCQFVALVVTVWVMIRNARRQLRAYVLPENAAMWEGTTLTPPQPERTNIPGFAMVIKNSGQTPAYRVTSFAQIAVINRRDENTLLVSCLSNMWSMRGRLTASLSQRFSAPFGQTRTPTAIDIYEARH